MHTTPALAEIQVLRKISTEINATLDLNDLFHNVLQTMDELFGFAHSLILLLEDDGAWLEVVAGHGYPETALGARVEVGTGLIGVVAKRRRMVRLGGMRQQRAYVSTIRREMEKGGLAETLDRAPSLPGLEDVESQLGIPLMVKDDLIGVFLVESGSKRAFSERDESLISIVANHAASAIHGARLLRELTTARDRLAELNETLEQRVVQRTEALERSNRELKETQAQLLQTAKLAALGDLVAGVAHEMNTPLGAIRSSADVARRAAERLSRASDGDGERDRWLAALDGATATAIAATERISGIVTSLKSFARLDEAQRKKANLHDGIEATLTLLHHKMDGRIEVARHFGDIPDIVCYPSRLNQLFMNVVVNAIQAIDGPGTITITSRVDESHAVLEFRDTGRGVSAEHLERIFDPGFTTKSAGVGTGLGLAIGYRIVEEHGGSISITSELGRGTVVTVRLPLST